MLSKILFRAGVILCNLLTVVMVAPGQGNLNPSDPPAPTMKTLLQVEPRVDLATVGGDGFGVYVIKGAGSFYLTQDLAGALGKHTIRVATAGRVTIDLNGFALTSTASGRSAVFLVAANDGIIIRNGIILAGNGTNAIGGSGSRVVCENLSVVAGDLKLGSDSMVTGCNLIGGGIECGDRSSVRDTISDGNGRDISLTLGDDSHVSGVIFTTGRGAFTVGAGGLIADCRINAVGPSTVFINSSVLFAGSGSVVRHCSVSAGNVSGHAIGIGDGVLVSGCRVLSAFRDGITSSGAANVTIESCSVQGNGRDGIVLGANARVRDCIVQGSGTSGIEVGENSVVTGCTVSGCQSGGIRSIGENVSVSHCTLRGNAGAPGISIFSGSIADCDVASTTGGAGIEVTQRSQVLRNRSENNGTISAPTDPRAGLRIVGPNNRVEDNHLINNSGFGLEITTNGPPNLNIGNLVIRNNARGNTAGQFNIPAGNAAGPIVTSAGATTTTIPTANFGP